MPAGTTETRSSDNEGLLTGFPGKLGLSGGKTVHGSVQVVLVVSSSTVVLDNIGSGAEVADVLQSGSVRVLSGRSGSSVLDSAGDFTRAVSNELYHCRERSNSLRGVQPLRVERGVFSIGERSVCILLLSDPVVVVSRGQVSLGSGGVTVAERSRHIGSGLESFEPFNGGSENSGEVSSRRNLSLLGDSNGVGLEVGQEVGRFYDRPQC